MSSTVATQKSARKILIVEDDKAVFGAVGQLLLHYGFDVTVAPTLKEAEMKYLDKPDLVVLDLMLPDGDGTDLLEKIRMQNSPTRVFVLSGNTLAEKDRKVRRLVPNQLFRKPFNFFEILSAIRHEFPEMA